MKWLALVLAFGLVEMMGLMFVAMSADASAHASVTSGTRSVRGDLTTASEQPAIAIAVADKVQFDSDSLQGEAPRKSTRKRSRNRCARITTTCWSAA